MNLNFIAFEEDDSFLPSGIYNLQLNPEALKIGFQDNKKEGNCIYKVLFSEQATNYIIGHYLKHAYSTNH